VRNPELVPENYLDPLNFESVFGRVAPLQIDLGSGEGTFLAAMAERHPEHNLLGIERLLGRVRLTAQLIAARALSHTRVFRIESEYALRFLIPPASASVLHVAFPDPWPKRRHANRRLVDGDFLKLSARILVSRGQLRLTTDDPVYFAQMKSAAIDPCDFREISWTPDRDYPKTDFERRFRERVIYRLGFEKIVD
jgi:tRNA (guanine-N7-)-methyltransferase